MRSEQTFFDDFGGETVVRKKYPVVYQAVMKGREGDPVASAAASKNTFMLMPPSIVEDAKKPEAYSLASGMSNGHLISNAKGHFGDGRAYAFMSGTLKNSRGEVLDSFAREYEQSNTSEVYDIDGELAAFIPDISSMNDMEYHSEGECYVVGHNEEIYKYEEQHTTPTLVEGGSSIIQEFKLKNPVYTNISHSDNIIVLYKREPFDDEKKTWDYKYPDNAPNSWGEVKTLLDFDGEFTVKENFQVVGYSQAGFGLKLIYEGAGEPVASYNYEQSFVGSQFKISTDKKKCTFKMTQDWNCPLDAKAYENNRVTLMLQGYFYVTVLNTKTQRQSMITIVVNSTKEKDKITFVTEGTALFIPPIAIRWGCFGKQTVIQMAEGTGKNIEAIRPDDIVAGGDGTVRRVVNIYSGNENKMIRITDVQEQHTYLTVDHPIQTAEGLKRANDVKPGDMLMQPGGGQTMVLYSNLIEYRDKVYNLELDPPGLVVANGYLCGDYEMQNELLIQNEEPREIKQEVRTVIDELRKMLKEAGKLR